MRNGHKYGAKKAQVDGYTFDSLSESVRYRELCLLQKAGHISGLEVHPKFVLQSAFSRDGKRHRAIYYEADFKYLEKGVEVVEEVKGKATETYRVKMKIFLFTYRQYDYRVIKV